MTAPDRIACLNPTCRRTASRAKMGAVCSEIICGKCFRALPVDMRARHRALWARLRLVRRGILRRQNVLRDISPQSAQWLEDRAVAALNEQWEDIRSYVIRPSKPVGLDGFLQEIGL